MNWCKQVKKNLKFNSYLDLHKWSVTNKSDFWKEIWKFTKINGDLKVTKFILSQVY